MRTFNRRRAIAALIIACTAFLPDAAKAAEPIRVGMSLALTGGVAPIGKQVLAALQIWRDDVNAKGGLLGRPVELVFYDDQSNPANVPQIYTKLIEADKVELLIGPYATNMVVPAIGQSPLSTLMQQFRQIEIRDGRIVADPATGKTGNPRYYAGGDCVNGGREVVDAVADGKRAALAMVRRLEALGG